MPTFRHGKNTGVVYKQYDLSAMLNNVGYQRSADLAETTAFGSSARSYIPGFPGGTTSLAGMFSGGVGEVDEVFSTALADSAAAALSIGVDGRLSTSGRAAFLAKVWDTAYNVTSPVNDVVAVTADFSYDEKMDTGKVLAGLITVTATGTPPSNGTNVDFTSTTSVGGVAHLHVVANTRDAGSIAIKIQDSADNSTFADISPSMAFASVSAGTLTSERITTTASLRRYIGVAYTVTGGTTGSYKFLVTLAKR